MNKRTQSSEKSKQAILDAATKEFAIQGLSGARTDAIAKAAGVNIALVFYYFKNKEQLYITALEQIFEEMNRRVTAALDCCKTNRERVLAYVSTHFDYLAEYPWRPRMVMQEYMRGGKLTSAQGRKSIQKYVKPLHERMRQVLIEGIAAGEFREMDVRQTQFSLSGLTTIYFVKSAIIEELTGIDPMKPDQLAARRKAVAEFVAAALFQPEASAPQKPRKSRKVS